MDSPNLAIWPNWVKYCSITSNLWFLNLFFFQNLFFVVLKRNSSGCRINESFPFGEYLRFYPLMIFMNWAKSQYGTLGQTLESRLIIILITLSFPPIDVIGYFHINIACLPLSAPHTGCIFWCIFYCKFLLNFYCIFFQKMTVSS